MSSPWNLRTPARAAATPSSSFGSPYGMSPVQISSSIPEASYVTSDAETAVREESRPFNLRVTSNVDCAVCQERFVDGETIRRLPCNHSFHSACVDPWLVLHARCPLCNSQMPGTQTAPSNPNPNPNLTGAAGRAAAAAARRRPPRERVGRRKKRQAQRNADLVTGAWLDHIVGGVSLDDMSDDDIDNFGRKRTASSIFNLAGEEFVDDVPMPVSSNRVQRSLDAHSSNNGGGGRPPKIDSQYETKNQTFLRHWSRVQKKIRHELRRECKRQMIETTKSGGLWKFVQVFEEYLVSLTRERRHGKLSSLPSCTNVDLLTALLLPPTLEGSVKDLTCSHPAHQMMMNQEQKKDKEDEKEDQKEDQEKEGAGKEEKEEVPRKNEKIVERAVLFRFKSSTHRLLAHGVTQFYGMNCKSVTISGHRIFRLIKVKKWSKRDNVHQVSLANDLSEHLVVTAYHHQAAVAANVYHQRTAASSLETQPTPFWDVVEEKEGTNQGQQPSSSQSQSGMMWDMDL